MNAANASSTKLRNASASLQRGGVTSCTEPPQSQPEVKTFRVRQAVQVAHASQSSNVAAASAACRCKNVLRTMLLFPLWQAVASGAVVQVRERPLSLIQKEPVVTPLAESNEPGSVPEAQAVEAWQYTPTQVSPAVFRVPRGRQVEWCVQNGR